MSMSRHPQYFEEKDDEEESRDVEYFNGRQEIESPQICPEAIIAPCAV